MKKRIRVRLDDLFFEKGFSDSLKMAQAFIIAGEVLVDGCSITKPGTLVKCDSNILVKEKNLYVSRGGIKLNSALNELNISVNNKICLDIGASTGGFTDCLLKNGAIKVYAVDVGHNLLHDKLRNDSRVISIEGTNFRYFSNNALKKHIEFATIDVSFISLDKILPILPRYLAPDSEVLALIKPQFEALRNETDKGVVRDEEVRQRTIRKIIDYSISIGYEIKGSVDSRLKGPNGNVEHFLWLGNKDIK